MTDLELLKKYLYPYYQTGEDEYLEAELTRWGSVGRAASSIWRRSAYNLYFGKIKSFDTGAESTEFHSLKEAMDFCEYMANSAENDFNKKNNTSSAVIAGVYKDMFIGISK